MSILLTIILGVSIILNILFVFVIRKMHFIIKRIFNFAWETIGNSNPGNSDVKIDAKLITEFISLLHNN